jgi:DNA-binding transcriptional LysR family regulator
MFPIAVFARAIQDFRMIFPETPLRVDVEGLGAVLQPVLGGRCSFAVTGFLPEVPPQLVEEHLLTIPLVTVVAPEHPLARETMPVPREVLAGHNQLVLTDRSDLTKGREFGVVGRKPWRLADIGAKRVFLLAGLGWGNMPLHLVQEDLAAGRLVIMRQEGAPNDVSASMRAVHRADRPPGPAGRWLIQRLTETAADCVSQGNPEQVEPLS